MQTETSLCPALPIERAIQHVLNENSLIMAIPMTDADIKTLLLALERNIKNGKINKQAHLSWAIVNIAGFITAPPPDSALPDHILWARKILRRLQELLYFFTGADTLHHLH